MPLGVASALKDRYGHERLYARRRAGRTSLLQCLSLKWLSLLVRRKDRDAQQLSQQPGRLGELLSCLLRAQTHLAAELVAAAVQHRHLQQRLAVVIEAAAGGVGKAQAEGAAGRLHHCRQRHFSSWSHFRLEAGEGSG